MSFAVLLNRRRLRTFDEGDDGGEGGGGEGGEDAPTLESIDRDTVSTAGGALLTLTGTNFVSGASVSIGGTAATSVTVVNSTTITCLTPAKAASDGYDVTVTTSNGSDTLTAALEVLPAATVIYESLNASALITNTAPTRLGNFVCIGENYPVYSTAQHLPGRTHSVKCEQVGNGTSYFNAYPGVNPAALSTGVYLSWWMFFEQAYLDNCMSKQGKISTWRKNGAGGDSGYFEGGFGAQIANAWAQWTVVQDSYGAYLVPQEYRVITAGVWLPTILWMKRTGPNAGIGRTWFKHRKMNLSTTFSFLTDNSSSDPYVWELGMIVNQEVPDDSVVHRLFLDLPTISNGFPDL